MTRTRDSTHVDTVGEKYAGRGRAVYSGGDGDPDPGGHAGNVGLPRPFPRDQDLRPGAQLPLEPEALRAARCARDLRAALDAGITSVREVGGLGVYLARAVAEGVLDGPAVYGAGAILSTTGGHGDLHCFPLRWMREYSAQDGRLRLADGPDECARAVREQLRRNARLIKVCASGGVFVIMEVGDSSGQGGGRGETRPPG